jgi:ribosomal protein S18 acetylase RimI-like enzyme
MSQANPQDRGEESVVDVARATRRVEPLTHGREEEALAFLAERPLNTFILSGFIRDNGLESERNRGDFYACRDEGGRLVGVALFGHAWLFEARDDSTIVEFARHARTLPPAHIVGGEPDEVGLFWVNYSRTDDPEPKIVRSLVFEVRHPVEVPPPAPELRPADVSLVEEVARVHAEIAFSASGVNPLEADPEGFLRRTAERVARGRVWVCSGEGRLNFKADVICETPEVIYLEGVYVAPSERGKGFGLRCLAQLNMELLKRARSVVVLVVEDNAPAVSLYRRAGFRLHGRHHLIFPAPRA